LKLQPSLADLAARCGLNGSADHLDYFLSDPQVIKKTPYLLLFRNTFGIPGVSQRGELGAAVILFEYDWMIRSRVFGNFDWTGRRNVLAPQGRRAEVAAQAARSLLDGGAHIAHISFSESYSDADCIGASSEPTDDSRDSVKARNEGAFGSDVLSTVLVRSVPLYLRIKPTFDATLAGIGKKTRANLRYYRRRSECELGCRFVPEAKVSLAEFLAFNKLCAFPVSDVRARWRYKALQRVPDHFLRGMVDSEGRWLSLVGGRKYCRFAEIDWQMNRADRPTYSLSTVLRSYLLEYESALGSTRLFIEGGTPSAIGHSFTEETVEDLIVKRSSPRLQMLERLYGRLLPPKNYVGQILRDSNLNWK